MLKVRWEIMLSIDLEYFISNKYVNEFASAIQSIPCNLNSEPKYQEYYKRDVERMDFSLNGWDPCEFNRTSFNKSLKKNKKSKFIAKDTLCVFCENNNEPYYVYRSHDVYDNEGKVICPKLRSYVCPTCGQTGDYAHTLKYCPSKPIVSMQDILNSEKRKIKYHKNNNINYLNYHPIIT